MQCVRRVVLVGVLAACCLSALGGVTTGVAAGQTATADTNVSVQYFVAPASDLGTLQSADTADEYGGTTLTATRFAIGGESLVVRLHAPNLAEAVADEPGDSRTERVLALLDTERASLRNQQYLSGSGSVPTTPSTLALTDPTVVTAVEVDRDTVDLVVDTSRLTATRDLNDNGLADDDQAAVAFDDAYFVNFTYDGVSNRTRFLYFRPNATVGPTNAPLRLVPDTNQTVTVGRVFPPGTVLTVDVVGLGDSPFQRSATVHVTQTNAFDPVAVFDLSGVPDGDRVSVIVRRGGETIAARQGRIVAYNATLSAPDRIAADRALELRTVSLSHDGFLVARADGPDGRTVAIESLAAGEYESVTLDVRDSEADRIAVLAYVDLNDDGVFDRGGPDRPTDLFDPVLATVERVPPENISTPTPTPETATRTPTPVSSPTRTAAPTDTSGGSGTVTTYTITDTSGPGFDVFAALLAVLLCAVALLGIRR